MLQLNRHWRFLASNPADWWKGPVNRHREIGHRTKNLFTHFKQRLCPSADNWVHPPHNVPKGNYYGTTTFPATIPASNEGRGSSASTKIPPGLKPGGTEPTYNADQAQRRPEFMASSNGRNKALSQCPLAYSSSILASFPFTSSSMLSTKPCVLPFWSAYAPTMSPSGLMPNGRVFLALGMSIGVN